MSPETLIRQFHGAVLRFDELGSIPLFSDDHEEQMAINKARANILRHYTRAYNRLYRALTSGDYRANL